jgi:Fe-S-cluster containining protein
MQAPDNDSQTYIPCPSCASCQDCCKYPNKPAYPFGFQIFEAIHRGDFPEKEISKLVILRIPESLLDDTARRAMYPLDNLFRHMTVPSPDGTWEFLALPTGKCIFLSPIGCIINEIKPFECGIYPFYLYKLEMRFDAWCPDVYKLEDTVKVREMVGKYIINYISYSETHKGQYLKELQAIKNKYKLPVMMVTSKYLHECEV